MNAMRIVRGAALGASLVLAAACSAAPLAGPSRDCTKSPTTDDGVDWCTRWRSAGYELHLTRAADWTKASTSPIARTEWEAAARSDRRLVEDGFVDWSDSGRSAVFEWGASDGPAMYWRSDQVMVKGVRSAAEIGEIVAFAQRLSANVVGDDGEWYDATGTVGSGAAPSRP
jgi:hypothetical protein